jgi:hypothetical protein
MKCGGLLGGATICVLGGWNHLGRSFSELPNPAINTTVTRACAASRNFIARLPGTAMTPRPDGRGLLACLLAQVFFHSCSLL